MWKTCFSASQNAKNESHLKHKNQVRNRHFIDNYVFEFEGLYLSLRAEHIKDNSFHNFNKINVNFEIFCLHVTGYLNPKISFPTCMFFVMASGKCELHSYFTFLHEILTYTHTKVFNFFFHNICRDVQHYIFSSR